MQSSGLWLWAAKQTPSRLAFGMASRPQTQRAATAAVTSYNEDTLASNPTRKRKATEELRPENTDVAVLSKKRAQKTAKAGSLEWILTSDKSPLTSLSFDVSVAV